MREREKETSLVPDTMLLTNATHSFNNFLVGPIILSTDTEFSVDEN